MLTEINGLQRCYNLRELNVSNNLISSVKKCNPIFGLKNLEVLHMARNEIDDDVRDVLYFCESLTVLIKVFTFNGNPVCNKMPSYKKTMMAIMRSLTSLDGKPVSSVESDAADRWMRGGLHEYSQMKDENLKNNDHNKTMAYFVDFQEKHTNTINEMKVKSSIQEQ